jgi:hypothetical protein
MRLEALEVALPSEGDAPAERRLLSAPLSLEPNQSVVDAFSSVIAKQEDKSETAWEGLMDEKTHYPLTTAFKPIWVEADVRQPTAKINATALFGGKFTPRGPYTLLLPWDAEPELFAKAKAGKAPFNGELKTAGDKRALDGAVDYVLLGMAHSLFGDAPANCWRFYARPPVGFGLVGFPYTAHLVSVELIGQLFAAPFSKPFVLGSLEHEAAVKSIPDIDFGEPIDFQVEKLFEAGKLHRHEGILWTMQPFEGHFLKFLPQNAPSSRRRFRQIFHVYRHLASLSAEGRPPALLHAELLYGFCCLCIRMPFVPGRASTATELCSSGGRVLDDVADALAWLLRNGILYVDVRSPNVVVQEEEASSSSSAGTSCISRVCLVDYDDAVVLPPGDAAVTATNVRGDVEEVLKKYGGDVRWSQELREAVLNHFTA